MANLDQFNSQFAIADTLHFTAGNGGLAKAIVTTPLAIAEIYLNGAHVTHFQPTGQKPVLFMSGKSRFEPGKPIRGGVPICFPWFGNLEGHPQAPAHGFARTSEWTVRTATRSPDGVVTLGFALDCHDANSTDWPHACSALYTAAIGSTLGLSLTISHHTGEPFLFEEALHTYFSVADVRQVSVDGLSHTGYLDKLQAGREFMEGATPVRITGETDRVYLDTTATCEIHDPVAGRTLVVKKKGSNATVLWNPWVAKSKAMADFGDDEWPGMLCIETCNVGRSAVRLSPGESHTMSAEISVKV